jgi:26S proteasome regulatory subunit N2
MATAVASRSTSAAGLLSLLSDPSPDLQAAALTGLDAVVGVFWAQIAGALPELEARAEDASFKDAGLAALLASKVKGGGWRE